MMAFFTIVVASTSLQPLIFDDALSHFVMTLRSPDTPDASKPSNSFLETTGGPTCHTILASTPQSATYAFISRYSVASWLENYSPSQFPEEHWDAVSIDFIAELPDSGGYDAIMVVVDSVGKWAHFVEAVTTIMAAGSANL